MADSDRALIRRALDGDNDAFGELLERYSPLVHGVLFERIRRTDEVEDLVQDVFVKAYQSLVTLRDARRFAPWIARIAATSTLSSVADAPEEHLQLLRSHRSERRSACGRRSTLRMGSGRSPPPTK